MRAKSLRSLSLLVFSVFAMASHAAHESGDGGAIIVGDGGGSSEQNLVFAHQSLPRVLSDCLSISSCAEGYQAELSKLKLNFDASGSARLDFTRDALSEACASGEFLTTDTLWSSPITACMPALYNSEGAGLVDIETAHRLILSAYLKKTGFGAGEAARLTEKFLNFTRRGFLEKRHPHGNLKDLRLIFAQSLRSTQVSELYLGSKNDHWDLLKEIEAANVCSLIGLSTHSMQISHPRWLNFFEPHVFPSFAQGDARIEVSCASDVSLVTFEGRVLWSLHVRNKTLQVLFEDLKARP